MANTNRNILHTIHTDEGALEIYWTRAEDDFPEILPNFEGFNSVLLHNDGAMTWKGWTDNEIPISVTIIRNRVVVAVSEDAHVLQGDEIVFDSAQLSDESTGNG